MKKKAYKQPEINVVTLQHQTQLMAGSLRNVETTGLGNEENLQYGDGNTKEGDAWNDAW